MRFDLGTLDSGKQLLPFGLLVVWCHINRGPPRAFRQGEVSRISGRSFGQNFGFPICSIHFNFSLSSKWESDVNQFRETFSPHCPPNWALHKQSMSHLEDLYVKNMFKPHESHDLNMVLHVVLWKRLLVDLTMASNSCMHRYLCKKSRIIFCSSP